MDARHRLVAAAAFLFSLLGVGTVGYRLIEGWPWFDCLYHTVITLTTIGYQEVHPMGMGARAFTMVLVVFSVVALALTVQALASTVLESDLQSLLWRRRMTQELARIEKHAVVCGYGRMGAFVAAELRRAGLAIVVVERDAERLQEAIEAGHVVVEGDATSDHVLREARVATAATAVCALPSDADNVFTALSLRVLNPDLNVIGRYDQESTRQKLLRAGATAAVSPVLMGGHRVVNMVLRPAATELLDAAAAGSDLDLRLEEFVVAPDSRLAGRPLHDADLRQEFGAIAVAVRRPDGRWIYSPAPDVTLEAGATVIVIGQASPVARLLEREVRPFEP